MSGTNSTTPITTTSSSSSIPLTTTTTSRITTTSSIPPSTTSSSVAPTTASTTTTSNIDTTFTSTASSAAPSTSVFTSVISNSDSSIPPVTVIVTATPSTTSSGPASSTSATTSTTSTGTSLQNNGSDNATGGLTSTGRTAIAVVVPVVAVALLVLAALFFWRKRKQRKTAEEDRRKEVEEYGYNPNNSHGPTLPAIATDGRSEMTEDANGGYRGWGAAAMSNRKPSTTLSAGHTQQGMSDAGSNHGNLSSAPTAFGGSSDGHPSDMYNHPSERMTNDDLAALGAAPAAGANRGEMRRGPSNASSSYSAGHRSDHSDPSLSGPHGNGDGPGSPQNYGYGQSGPYGDGSYGGAGDMPVVRDVSARRNTRIEQGGGYQQANSGIAQNF